MVQDLDFCPSRRTVMALVLWGRVVEDDVVLGGGDWTLTTDLLWAKLFLNNVAVVELLASKIQTVMGLPLMIIRNLNLCSVK